MRIIIHNHNGTTLEYSEEDGYTREYLESKIAFCEAMGLKVEVFDENNNT